MALTTAQYYVLLATLAWLGAWAVRPWRRDWDWTQHAGLALVLYPFGRMLVGIALTIELLGQYTVLRPYGWAELWWKTGRHLLHYLGVPGVGLLLVHRRVPGRDVRWRELVPSLDEVLHRERSAPRHGWRGDLVLGLALFLPLLVGYLVAMGVLLAYLQDALVTGDESQVWRNITIPLILALSVTAAVTEELLFRGILQHRLQRWMPAGVAIVVQAVFFGFTHTGYGTWAHVLGPVLFGLAAGWVAHRMSVPVAMVLHAEVNVAFFSLDVADVVPAALALPALLLVANAVAAWRTGLAPYRVLLGLDDPEAPSPPPPSDPPSVDQR